MVRNFESEFEGIINALERRFSETKSPGMKAYYESYMSASHCTSCDGARLKKKV